MLTDFLLAHQWIAPITLVLMILVGPPVGSRLVSRPRVAWWVAAVSLVPIVMSTLVPQDRRLFSRCEISLDWYWPTPGRVELMANVVLFVAPVPLVSVATRRPLMALVLGSGLSLVIEAIQAGATPLGRSCDSHDWLTNTMGASIGAALGWCALRIARPPTHAATRT